MATGIILLAIRDAKGIFRLIRDNKNPPGLYFPLEKSCDIKTTIFNHIKNFLKTELHPHDLMIHHSFEEKVPIEHNKTAFSYLVWLKTDGDTYGIRSQTLPEILRKTSCRKQRLAYLKALQALARVDDTPLTVEYRPL